ncbi:MAG: HEAT repeat domain-containing protein [Candidatus Omnitrophica bacterium]|nr:HEAT repeat domain-containing protein [Candidatus Omnitrophota bacterium]
MDQHLQELKSKQRKLIFLFGEAVYKLYKSKEISFGFASEDRPKEQEIEKITRLLDYLDERITKIEELEDEDEEESEDDTAVYQEEDEIEDEVEDELEAESAVEDEKEDEGEIQQEAVVEDEIELEETSTVESEVNKAVEEESSASSPFVEERIRPDDTLTRLLETASFNCDADRRLFEKNINQLSMGTQREREVAIGQIAHITPKDILHQVYEFAMKDESSLVRLAVIKNVSRMKQGEAEGFFDLGMNDADAKVRTAAVKGLGSHVSDRNRKILDGLLSDSDEHIRGLAVTYLGIYYGKEGVKKAITAWEDTNPYVRISLLEMLSIVKPEGALTVVKNLLSDKEQDVKKAAEKALEKLMPERKRNKNYGKRKR